MGVFAVCVILVGIYFRAKDSKYISHNSIAIINFIFKHNCYICAFINNSNGNTAADKNERKDLPAQPRGVCSW
jgi:hypothetical protein